MHNSFRYKFISYLFLALNRNIYEFITVVQIQRNMECEILKECRSLLHGERNITDTLASRIRKCLRTTCRVTSREKTEQGKKRDAWPWEEGKGLFNGESSGFCSITGDDPAATKNHSAPLKHRESHGEVFRPVHAGAALKSPIRAAFQIRKGKHIDENNTREKFVGSLARRAGAPLRCVAYNRAIITTSLRHFIVASCNDCFN